MGRIQLEHTYSRKGLIIEKAAALFKEKGYLAASMRELADRVGVEAASLYNHIEGKSEILQEICFSTAQNFLDNMDSIEASDCSYLEKLEQVLRFKITEMVLRYSVMYVTEREWKYLPEPFLTDFQNLRRAYRKRFATIIEKGIEDKTIREIDPTSAVLIMLHAISGIESWHRSKEKINGKILEDNMISIFIGGLKN